MNLHSTHGFRATWIVQCIDMHLMYVAAQGNGSHPTIVLELFKCLKLLLPLQKFFDTFLCPYHASRHKITQSCIILDEDIQLFNDPADSYFEIAPCTSLEQPLHFLAQPHTWNARRQDPHWCNDAYSSKSVRRITIQVSEILLSTELNSALYCHNAGFPHPHSYMKSAFAFLTYSFETPSIYIY